MSPDLQRLHVLVVVLLQQFHCDNGYYHVSTGLLLCFLEQKLAGSIDPNPHEFETPNQGVIPDQNPLHVSQKEWDLGMGNRRHGTIQSLAPKF